MKRFFRILVASFLLVLCSSVCVSAAEPSCSFDTLDLNAGNTYTFEIENLDAGATVEYRVVGVPAAVSVNDKGTIRGISYGANQVQAVVTQNEETYTLTVDVRVYDSKEPALDGRVYRIREAAELAWLSEQVAAGNNFEGFTFLLGTDIDLAGPAWSSIGYNLNNYFSGTFDGNGFTIRNFEASGNADSFTIINAPRHTTGLFGVCLNAKIKRLVLEGADLQITNTSGYQNSYSSIDGTSIYGAVLCGYAVNSTFQNITVKDSEVHVTTGAESACAYAGGILGYGESCSFAHCRNEGGMIRANTTSLLNSAIAGGIVGELVNEGTIRQCSNKAQVCTQSNTTGGYSGGIAGKTSNQASTLSSIRDCYNQGTIYHFGSYLATGYSGGIVGYSSSTVNRCYNSGTLYTDSDTVDEAVLGGIAGSGITSSSVSNSAMASSAIIGGTSRYLIAGAGSKENNLANQAASGTNDATERLEAEEFQTAALYQEKLLWDFGHIWKREEREFPELQEWDADQESDIFLVEDAAEAVTILLADGDTYYRVTQNVTLVGSPNEAEVRWNSSNPEVVSNQGTVTRPEEEHQVRMTAVISSGDYSVQKRFLLNVMPTSGPTATEPTGTGLTVDEARTLVSLMHGASFKDIPVDDPDVLVLTGEDVSEAEITEFLVRLMQFMEVPGESAYLKSKIGDVIGLIEAGTEEAVSEALGNVHSDVIDEALPRDARVLVKAGWAAHSLMEDFSASFRKIRQSPGEAAIDTLMSPALENCANLGEVFLAIGDEEPEWGGSVAESSNTIWTFFGLMNAFDIETKNSMKAYLNMYVKNRPYFDSAEDEAFVLLMAAANVSNFANMEEDLDRIGELIYQLDMKFGGDVPDEYKVTIQCPVDVTVYDSAGRIAGRVTNNVVDRSIRNSLRIEVGGVDQDEKTVYLPVDGDYSIMLVGNDTGSMTVLVEDPHSGDLTTHHYDDIALEGGKTMTMELAAERAEEGKAPVIQSVEVGLCLDEDAKEADGAKKQYALTVYPYLMHEDENLRLSLLGGYCNANLMEEGKPVRDMLVVNPGYLFDGFYTDAACTKAWTAGKMPASALTLYAKFLRNDSNITIEAQPQNGEYYVGDPAEPLSVTLDGDGDYTCQWYRYSEDKSQAQGIEGAVDCQYTPDTLQEGTFYYFLRVFYQTGEELRFLDSEAAQIRVRPKVFLGSGSCGDGLNWSVTLDGTLSISGEGSMDDFEAQGAPWYALAAEIRTVEVSDTVTSVGTYAFQDLTELKTLTLPDSIASIAAGALSGCSALEALTLPFVGLSREAVGADAVLGSVFGMVAGGITQYHELNGVNLGGYPYAIPATLRMVTITDAKALSFGAFCNCSMLTEITLNEGIETIEGYSFRNCSGLSTLTLPDTVTTIGKGALGGCVALEELTVPFVGLSRSAVGADGVLGAVFGTESAGISQYHELNGTSLNGYSYGIPATLRKVAVTDATALSFGAFYNCSMLTEIALNEGLETIGTYSLRYCSGLKTLTVPDSVSSIAESALHGCTALQSLQVPFVGLTQNATGAEAVLGAVFGRGNSSGVLQFGVLNGSSLSGYYYNIPSGLTAVTLTRETGIPLGAFSNCSNLTQIQLNDGVTSMGIYAFYNCTGLDTMEIPASVETMDPTCLNNCLNLTVLCYSGTTAHTFCETHQIPYQLLDEEHAHIWGNWSPVGEEHTRICEGCRETETKPHVFGSWTTTGEQGHSRSCSECSRTETATHRWDAGCVTAAPSCGVAGEREFTCQDCSETKTEAIQALSHDWSAWTNSGAQHSRTCGNCGDEETAAHALGTWTTTGEAEHSRSCSECSHTETAAHRWDAGHVTAAPSCGIAGEMKFACQDCPESRTTGMDALKHQWENGACVHCGQEDVRVVFEESTIIITSQMLKLGDHVIVVENSANGFEGAGVHDWTAEGTLAVSGQNVAGAKLIFVSHDWIPLRDAIANPLD